MSIVGSLVQAGNEGVAVVKLDFADAAVAVAGCGVQQNGGRCHGFGRAGEETHDRRVVVNDVDGDRATGGCAAQTVCCLGGQYIAIGRDIAPGDAVAVAIGRHRSTAGANQGVALIEVDSDNTVATPRGTGTQVDVHGGRCNECHIGWHWVERNTRRWGGASPGISAGGAVILAEYGPVRIGCWTAVGGTDIAGDTFTDESGVAGAGKVDASLIHINTGSNFCSLISSEVSFVQKEFEFFWGLLLNFRNPNIAAACPGTHIPAGGAGIECEGIVEEEIDAGTSIVTDGRRYHIQMTTGLDGGTINKVISRLKLHGHAITVSKSELLDACSASSCLKVENTIDL